MNKSIKFLSVLALGTCLTLSAFAQNLAFLYNKGQEGQNAYLYVQVSCNGIVVPTGTNKLTSGQIFSIPNDKLTSSCPEGANLTVGISKSDSAYDYSYCSNKVSKFTTAATPQASYTIDYTNGNPAYQCF